MGLFKQPEHRRFNLKPRYWDPEAEARKEREKLAPRILELTEELAGRGGTGRRIK